MRVRERLGGFRQTRAGRVASRVVAAVLGTTVIVVGIVLIPFPGPGWFIVFTGLAILATEFAWARRLLKFARRHLAGWWRWIGRQHTFVRVLVGLAGLIFVGSVVWLSLWVSLGSDPLSGFWNFLGN
jgi:uncharacterized protein (TIGR02611 family)